MAQPIVNIKFLADLRQFSTGMQNASRKMDRLGKKLQGVGTTLSVGLTAPLVAFGATSLKSFDKQEKAIAQVEAGLRSTGNAVGFVSEELQKQASDLQSNTLFGDEEILSGVTAQLLTFTNIANEQFSRTQQAALDLATRLDGDLKSASIQLGKALNDPIANLSALSRSGIQFSEDQKAVIKSLTETGRLAEAQTLILNELEKQYGGSAEAAAKAGLGPLKQLSNAFGDLQEEIGGIIAEGLLPFVESMKGIVDGFKNLSPQTKKFIVIAGGIAAAIGPLLALAGTILPALTTGFAILTGPIGLVVAALAAVGVVIYKYWEPLKNYFVDLYNESVLFRGAIQAIKVSFENVLAAGKFVFGVLGEIIKVIGATIKNQFKTLGDVIGALLKGDFSKIPGILKDGFKQGFSDFGTLIEGTVEKFKIYKDTVQENVTNGVEAALRDKYETTQLTDQVSDAVAKGTQQGLSQGLSGQGGRGKVSAVQTSSAGLASAPIEGSTDGLSRVFSGLLDFEARLMEFEGVTANIMTNVAQNFVEGFANTIAAIATGNAGFGAIGALLLNTMADLAQQLGKAAIQLGVTMIAVKKLFSNPVTAIAAGAGLLVIAGIMRSLAGSFGGGGDVPKFANGGIVGGSSFYGDKILARVNSGELILNQNQQKNLDSIMESGGQGSTELVKLEIEGTKLVGVLKRTMDRNGRMGGKLSLG